MNVLVVDEKHGKGSFYSKLMEKSRKSESMLNGNRAEASTENDNGLLSPGATFMVFNLMEDLIDKMKLLNYEIEFAKEFNLKPLSR